MNVAIKMIMFFLILNLSTGIVTIAAISPDKQPIFSENWMTSGMTYNESLINTFDIKTNKNITPSTGQLQDSGDASYRILDMISLGIIGKIVNAVDSLLFGFLNLLKSLFTPLMTVEVANKVFGILKGLVTIMYVILLVGLFTGKDLKE